MDIGSASYIQQQGIGTLRKFRREVILPPLRNPSEEDPINPVKAFARDVRLPNLIKEFKDQKDIMEPMKRFGSDIQRIQRPARQTVDVLAPMKRFAKEVRPPGYENSPYTIALGKTPAGWYDDSQNISMDYLKRAVEAYRKEQAQGPISLIPRPGSPISLA